MLHSGVSTANKKANRRTRFTIMLERCWPRIWECRLGLSKSQNSPVCSSGGSSWATFLVSRASLSVMVLMLASFYMAAKQGKRLGFHYFNVNKLTDQQGIVAAKVYNTVKFVAPLQQAGIFFRIVGHQNALGLADHAPAVFKTLLLQALLQNCQTLFFYLFRGGVGQLGRRGAGAGAVDKGIGKVEADFGYQVHGLLKVLVGFAGEANDKVRADQHARYRRLEFADA